MSAQVPYGVGLTISAPAACGVALPGRGDLLGRRRVGRWQGVPARADPPWLHPGEDQTRDDRLVAVAPENQMPSWPATAIIAALTDSELPHVEKNACAAPTASAISSSAAGEVAA